MICAVYPSTSESGYALWKPCTLSRSSDGQPMSADPGRRLPRRSGRAGSFTQRRKREREELAQLQVAKQRSDQLLNVVVPIGIALAEEQDFNHLLERILLEAKSLCHADGGTLYLCTDDDRLKFMILRTNSLNLALGGTTGVELPFQPLRLYDAATGDPNQRNVATYAVLRGTTINIPDAYEAVEFEFSGTRAFDKDTGYRTMSMLTIPLKNAHERVIGVIQLLNALDPETGAIVAFDAALQQMVELLAALATVALEGYIQQQALRDRIAQLRIEIDDSRRVQQVAEITESDYFQQLQAKVKTLRGRPGE